ncbi:MAG: AAA family ATPase [Flavobacteriales bacterium]|nr:AAA family ATPase [Flavobacteriales bacterium]MCB9168380.1 AAA family ATPase [Flavobacteriales bacterium]
MPSSNQVVFAAAGSGKTASLVSSLVADQGRRVLVLSYTQENVSEIRSRVVRQLGFVPAHVTIQGWFTFLLKDGVRPYQNYLYNGPRIESMQFDAPKENWFKTIPKSNTSRYYFTSTGKIYRDRMSDFIVEVNRISGGRVINRICQIYDAIYIDEIQDLTGWDLDVLDLLIDADVDLVMTGDVRQAILSTTNSTKHPKYRGAGIVKYFVERERKGRCTLGTRSESYRCKQSICDFADALFPELRQPTTSLNKESADHEGVFLVKPEQVPEYVASVRPQVLRYSKDADVFGNHALNIGVAKGQTFDHVLIFLQGTGQAYLATGRLTKTVKGVVKPAFHIPKLYVAVTRARFSVAFVYDGVCVLPGVREYVVGRRTT